MNQFDLDTAVTQIDENLWRGKLCAGWRIGTVPNGGYVLSVAGRVLREALPHGDPLSVSSFFLAPTELGAIDCRVEVMRLGGNTSHAVVKMYQKNELKVQVTAAYTNLAQLRGENWSKTARPVYPHWDDCAVHASDTVEFRERVELRFAEGGDVFSGAQPCGRAEFRGWIQHRDGSSPDVMALLMFADALPPPIFNVYGPLGWVPTIELTVQVRAHPAPGPVQARLYSQHLTEGVIEEDGEFWDCTGKLVAISRQAAKLRVPKTS
ncbi:MAG: thioesterase family protein [Halieaceae bacterium]|jgi:acyl-CoA thioesterase|nr:thioesterase family protein [Halieaceae bacterium]